MADTDEWFALMSQAVRQREIALAGRARWQEKVNAAETRIEELTLQRDTPVAAPDPVAQQEEVAAVAASPLQPVFGITTPQN